MKGSFHILQISSPDQVFRSSWLYFSRRRRRLSLSLTQELLSEWIFDGAMTATVRPGERVAIASHSSASLRRAKTAFSLPVLKPFSRMC